MIATSSLASAWKPDLSCFFTFFGSAKLRLLHFRSSSGQLFQRGGENACILFSIDSQEVMGIF